MALQLAASLPSPLAGIGIGVGFGISIGIGIGIGISIAEKNVGLECGIGFGLSSRNKEGLPMCKISSGAIPSGYRGLSREVRRAACC